MRRIAFAIAILGVTPAAALAGPEAQACSRGSDERVIEVLTPGVVGRACDLKVTRDSGSYVSTPYHANNSADFCSMRAQEMIAGLSADGYTCAARQAQVTAAVESSAAAEEAAPVIVEAPPEPGARLLAAEVGSTVQEATADEQLSIGDGASANTLEGQYAALSEAPPPLLSADADAIAATPSTVVENPATVLDQPPAVQLSHESASAEEADLSEPRIASAGPIALAPTQASALAGVTAPRPSRGRFIGAAPEEKPLDLAPPTEVAEERLAARPIAAPAVDAAASSAAARAAIGAAQAQPRAVEDVIKSVLAAQAAAWNEGDLEAFMGVYWKDQALRLVSGSNVANGWKDSLRFYRERYGDGASMGRLAFEGLDVDMITPDVATVYGRYSRQSQAGSEAGAFTLVMKRLDGLWRIVSDHTVPDMTAAN